MTHGTQPVFGATFTDVAGQYGTFLSLSCPSRANIRCKIVSFLRCLQTRSQASVASEVGG